MNTNVSKNDKVFRAGGVTRCHKAWAEITQNKWVNNMVKGLTLELTAIPRQTRLPASETRVNKSVMRGKIE